MSCVEEVEGCGDNDSRRPPPARLVPLAVLSVWLGSTGCTMDAEQPGEEGSAARATQPLARGEATGISDLRAVAGLATPHPGGCTATYIGNRVVLTAAHCVSPFGSGCVGSTQPPEDIEVTFADQFGDPTSVDAQRIRVLGFAVHPNAWSDRVTSCPDPVPPLVACPADVSPYGPSCNLVEQCQADAMKRTAPGFHVEHDIALAYLESDPIGIDPLPVIVASIPMVTHSGTHAFPGLLNFLDTQPIVTLVGYGGGSTDWCTGNPWCGGRNYGTTHLAGRYDVTTRWDQCNGTRGPVVTINMLRSEVRDRRNAYTRMGDSGGPLLIGLGQVGAMETPTPIPASSGLAQGRYVAGVASLGGDWPVPGTACSAVAACAAGEDCVGIDPTTGQGSCATRCIAEIDCPTTAACMPDAAAGQHYCRVPSSSHATTYDNMNGIWISAAMDDIDLDGVPNDDDNCVSVKNPDQANCNLDAELDRQGDALGDACDPVPCPAASAPISLEVPLLNASAGCIVMESARVVRRDIDPEVLGSHNPINGAAMDDRQKRAAFRFCPKRQDPLRQCTVLAGERHDESFDNHELFSIWRNVTLPSLGPTGSFTTWDFPSDFPPMYWDDWTDRERWLANDWMESSEPAKPNLHPDSLWQTVSGIDGAFGLRAGLARSHDMLGNANQNANGIHYTPDLGDGYATGEGLARAYIDMAPDKIVIRHGSNCSYSTGCQGPLCDQGVLAPLRWCIACKRPLEWWNPILPVDSVLAKATDGRLGLVDEKGRIVVVDGMLSPTLTDRLSDPDLLLVGAVEPYLDAGRGYRGVQGVFVKADATATVGSIVGNEDGFRMQREEIIDRDPILKSATVAPAGAAPLDGIPSRTGFAAVLSRTLGALIIAGGTDASSGQPSRDIWMVPEQGLPSQLVVPGYAPARVLAVTVAPADGAIWILDELRLASWLRIARLVRIDPGSGEHEIVWRGPRLGLFDRQWLGADRDGQVLLFSSSNALRKHVIVRFEAEPYVIGTSHAVLARFGQGALLGAPLVDHAGYQIVTGRSSNRIRSDRIGSLGQRPGLVVDLTKCL